MLKVSREFRVRLKLSDRPVYKISMEAGLAPTALYKLVAGIHRIKPRDPRIVAVARILGLRPEEAFEVGFDLGAQK